ncbi:MAG: hypothetical protein V4543_18245 [Bacteroidota bacterium]
MLLTLFHFLLIGFICLQWGLGINVFFAGLFKVEFDAGFSFLLLSGLTFIGIVSMCLSLFTPLNVFVGWAWFGSATALLYLFRKENPGVFTKLRLSAISLHLGLKLIAAAIVFIALVNAVSVPDWYDDGLYYVQTVRWLQQYPVVPGLANLIDQLGFNSVWHITLAAFNFLPGKPFHDLNAWLLLALLPMGLSSAQRLISGESKPTAWLGLFFLLQPFVFNGYYFSSPAPDMAVACFTIFVLSSLLQMHESGRPNSSGMAALTVIVIYSCIIKASAVGFGVLALYLILFFRGKPRATALFGITAFLVAGTWMLRNYYLSGYILYPMLSLDFFSPDWKVPHDYVLRQLDIIESSVKLDSEYRVQFSRNFPSQIEHIFRVPGLGKFYWLPHYLRTPEHAKAGFFLYGIPLFFSIALSYFWAEIRTQKRFNEYALQCLVFILWLLVSFAVWFTAAPGWRFAIGMHAFVFLISLFVLTRKAGKTVLIYLVFGLLGIGLFSSLRWSAGTFLGEMKAGYWTIPGSLPGVETGVVLRKGIPLHYRVGGTRHPNTQVWNTPLPAVSIPYDTALIIPIGPGIKDGFKRIYRH